MAIGREHLEEARALLEDRFGDDAEAVMAALATEPQVLRIPVEVFSGARTPLQAASAFLVDQGLDRAQIARFLSRPQSTVAFALRGAADRPGADVPDQSAALIPQSAFSDPRLTPSESLVLWLDGLGHTNASIAKLLARDPRNTWKTLQSARRKTGGVA